jgi:hypothetical protein
VSPYRSNGRARDTFEDSCPSPLAILKPPSEMEQFDAFASSLREDLNKIEKSIQDMKVAAANFGKDNRSKSRKALDYFLNVCWWMVYWHFV